MSEPSSGTEHVNIPKRVAQVVFDVAVGSMDFGSGFLDAAEVDALRAYATVIGVDPMEATPVEDRPRYCPGHVYKVVGFQEAHEACIFCRRTRPIGGWE